MNNETYFNITKIDSEHLILLALATLLTKESEIFMEIVRREREHYAQQLGHPELGAITELLK